MQQIRLTIVVQADHVGDTPGIVGEAVLKSLVSNDITVLSMAAQEWATGRGQLGPVGRISTIKKGGK